MKRKIPGYFITSTTIGEKVKAFVPNPLPPEPPLDTGMQAVHTTKQLVAIYTDDRNCINNLGRTAGSPAARPSCCPWVHLQVKTVGGSCFIYKCEFSKKSVCMWYEY